MKYKSFCGFLKVEITRFTCHAMNSVSYGSTMLLKMALKKKTGKLRKLWPNNQSFLSKDFHLIKNGTGEHNREINRARKNLEFQLALLTGSIQVLLAQCKSYYTFIYLFIWPSTCLGPCPLDKWANDKFTCPAGKSTFFFRWRDCTFLSPGHSCSWTCNLLLCLLIQSCL